MIDLHTHTILSDGELLPSEMVRQAEVAGYTAIALTDHADLSNIDFVLPRLVKVTRQLNKYWKIFAIPGVELTYVPVEEISALTRYARKSGAKIVIAHGESVSKSEPVMPGTNYAAISAGVDILAHPGLLTEHEARLAARRGVALELSLRPSHAPGNRHVARVGLKAGCTLVLNSDAHSYTDLASQAKRSALLAGLGLTGASAARVYAASRSIAQRAR